MARSRAYNRNISRRKAIRKKRISDSWYGNRSWYPALGYYRKGKIHCSCGMCMRKTRNKGRKRYVYGNYAPCINYKYRDLQRKIDMDQQEEEYFHVVYNRCD